MLALEVLCLFLAQADAMMQWTTAMSKQYETHFNLGASKRYNLGFMDKYVRRCRQLIIVIDASFPSDTLSRD